MNKNFQTKGNMFRDKVKDNQTTNRWSNLTVTIPDNSRGDPPRSNGRWSKFEVEKKEDPLGSPPRLNGRWSKLETDQEIDQNNSETGRGFKQNNFKKSHNTHSRWNNLESDTNAPNNSFRHNYRPPKRNYRRSNGQGSGLFSNTKIINGVPQVVGGIQKSVNLMDTIQIKPQKKSSKKRKSSNKRKSSGIFEGPEETEEDKKQKELLKKQMLEQYAYEYDTDEDE